jgi:uncharacterized membrane protein YkvA (DUF1232 family)
MTLGAGLGWKRAWQGLRQAARLLKRDGLTLWFALQDARTPRAVKLLAVVVVGYALSPIDLIPDFIPILGLLDDLVLLPGLVWLALRLLPAEVKARARQQAEAHWSQGLPKLRLRWGVWVIVALWSLAGVGLWIWWF